MRLPISHNLGPVLQLFKDTAHFLLTIFGLRAKRRRRSEDPRVIIRAISFELPVVQPIRARYINVTDGQTNRQTDRRTTTIAVPRALH